MRHWIMFFVCGLALSGCSIRVNDNRRDWDDDWSNDGWSDGRTQEERAADTCDPYCIELIACGVLSDSAFVACRDLCMERFEDDESGVTEGVACIQAAQCQPTAARYCEGDPLSRILDGTDDHSGNGGLGGASGGGDYSVEE